MSNVIIYVHDLRSSGVVRDALTMATRFARDHFTTLVAGSAEGLFAAEAAAGPFRLVTLAVRPGLLGRIGSAWRLHRWLRHEPGGVLASLGNVGHSAVYLATCGRSRFQRIYRISNEIARGTSPRTSRRMFWMQRLIGDASRIMLVGEALGRAPIFAPGLAAGRIVTLPSGVDLDRARRLAAAPSPHPWLDAEIPLVLGIGRLRPQKDFDLLIEAVGKARRERRLRLAIIGGGTPGERLRLERLAAAAGLGDDFLLAGETENVFAWAARASVFALSSRWEGSSLALLEALAVGVPVVATRNAGDAADVLGDGVYGAVVEADDPAGFAAALLAQVSPQAVLPGERAACYDLAALADRYAGVVADVIAADPREA